MRFILSPLLFPLLLCLLTFFISSSSSSSGEAGNGDVKALIAFKTSSVTRDPNGFFTGWTAADSLGPCSWRGVICSLQSRVTSLDLSDAQISGSLHLDLLLGSLPLLQHLHLRGNNFTGNRSHVFPCNLVTLDLSSNYFSNSNPIPLSCHRLTYLNLSHNGLQHKIPSVLGSFKNLEVLSLAKNQFSGEIPPELGRTCGSIRVLDLAGNALQGGLPSTFISCSSLQTLNLESNELSGDFLDTVVGTLPALRELLVSFNNLKGPIPPSIANCSHLQVLDLRFNHLNGSLPSWFCSALNSSLAKILLAGNLISGAVPPELGNCKNLKRLDLSFNKLRGSIPWQVWALPNLSDLVMWGNSLTGELPETICFSGGNLETLILNNNLITGTIPVSLASCTNLIMVSLSSNRLTGEVHSGLANLNNLAILQLGNNSLTGEIPKELGKCESLIWLDLSSNNFSGSIPPELSSQSGLITPVPASRKQYAYLRSDRRDCSVVGGLVEFDDIRAGWFASSPWAHSCSLIYTRLNLYSFTNNGTMIYLDLSYNSLSGAIPDTFGSMSDLLVLNLGHNMLTGSIPDVLGDLKQVEVLDVSYNELQGFLPRSLGMLTFLSDFDVSNNNLTGPIPSHGQLATFVSSRYENNSGLCGVPLPPCGAGSAISDNPDLNSTGKEHFIDAGLVFSVIAGVITGLAFTLYFHTLKHYCKKK